MRNKYRFLCPGAVPTSDADHLLKLVLRQDDIASRMDWDKWEPLPDVREIHQDELADTVFCTQKAIYMGCWHFPIIRRGVPVTHTLCNAFILWDGTGLAFDRCWKYDYNARNSWSLDGRYHRLHGPKYDRGMPRNKMTVRIYRFGCEHEYHERNDLARQLGVGPLFSHDHLHYCVKCGHHFVVDSSD